VSSEIRSVLRPACRWLLGVLLVVAASSAAAAKGQSSSFTLEVPAHGWKVARFRGLPRRGTLTVDVVTSGPVEILLFDVDGYRRFPSAERPLIRGSTADKFGFSARLPRSGDYFLVLDNRAGAEARQVSVAVTAASAARQENT
jgi:hypothetical protein